MNVPLFIAGCLAVLAAAVHGGVGERIVVQKLEPRSLPGSRFGGPRMTKAMIHVSWHIVTVAFLAIGCALIVAATSLDGAAQQATGVVAAAAFTGFAVVGIGLGLAHSRRSLIAHPGPLAFVVTAALAWTGAL